MNIASCPAWQPQTGVIDMKKLIPTILAAAMLALAAPVAQAGPSDFIWLHPSDLMEQGKQAIRDGDYAKAIAVLERFLKSPSDENTQAAAHNNLCIAYEFSGNLDAAIEHCDAAIKLEPKHWGAYNNRANAYFFGGDFVAASADYQRALDLNPSAEAVRTNLELAESKTANQ